jgi:hypothetical protein
MELNGFLERPFNDETAYVKIKEIKGNCYHLEKEKELKIQVEFLEREQNLESILINCPSQIFSTEEKDLIRRFEKRKDDLLRLDEEAWHLNRRVFWLKSGDKNTKLFHKFVEYRRKENSIWDIEDLDENLQSSHDEIGKDAYNFFKTLYKARERQDVLTQLQVLKEVPRFFSDEESDSLGRQVTLQEVEHTIKIMPKDKSPGHDGWTHELFHHFFDIMGELLLATVEE